MAKSRAQVEQDYQLAKASLEKRASTIKAQAKDAKALNKDTEYRRLKALAHKHLERLNFLTRYENINAEVAKAKAAKQG